VTALGRPKRDTQAQSTPGCAHCGNPVGDAGRFCCSGCEAAHAVISGLGLDAFYRRATLGAGTLKPLPAPEMDFAPLVRALSGGRCEIELLLGGLTCGACVWLVEQTLAAEPDVERARVALSTRRLTLTWRGEASRANALAARLAGLGFRVAPWSPACLRVAEDAESREVLRALGIASFGAMNVMLVSVAVWAGGDMDSATRHLMHWLAALIGMPTVLVAGMPFYRSAWRGLAAGRPNMDLAVSLGVLLTTAMSLSETLRNGPYTWFDGATALLALLLAGRVLDRAARRRARQAVAELLALQDGTVTALDAEGHARTRPVESVAAGEILLVTSGERIRLDGVLLAAEAVLDTAATTGESLPRDYAEGDALPAGAVNLGAPFRMRVTAAARDGSLAALSRLIERAEANRGRYVALADRAARFYVPVAHAIALATFLGWWAFGASWQEALVPAVAALIITCPCALALAVPAVQVVATGALFRRGVLVASPTALERLAEADVAVLDKTGTLTEGRPALLGPAPLLAEAASLARASRHPLARALVAACPEAPPRGDVVEHPGQGLLAADGARLGSARFLGLAPEPRGMTLHYWAPSGEAVAFRFADRLRPDAREAVEALRAQGLEVELLSGDGAGAVEQAARESGIASWRAGVDPAGKAARIADLTAQGHRVLMVGDGLNDAAALAAAHVSAAPAEGSDLAQTASDLVLRAHGPALLPGAIATARRARRIARQNIAFSLAYNAIAVPAAVLGLATPLIAALVMASSSLIVTLNALRAGRPT
jgi:P-type Cu2+ transporter